MGQINQNYICIDNSYYEDQFTIGKIYRFYNLSVGVGISLRKCFTMSDENMPCVYPEIPENMFQSVEDWRDEQIKLLLN